MPNTKHRVPNTVTMNTIIHTPTNNLAESLDFYTRLNFQVIPHEQMQLVSDGQCLLEINPDRYARAGIKLFKVSWQEAVTTLEKMTVVHATKGGLLLNDPNGVRIYLMEAEPDLAVDLSAFPGSKLGNFAGISLESTDLLKSQRIWEALDFAKTTGGPEQGWLGLKNQDGMVLSIMRPNTCPHLFFNPSLTYFNGKTNNPVVIQKIREAGIPITEEITQFNKEGIVDNIIIRDPGGYGFFIFND